ncbi:protein phosphatase 2C domain-containing protein [Longispora sp. NPDC051575]|uniref:PP2C family protein-serine/threonine phosphatase n=1 Tax=Longispora sp. NPDC051575 TaxID=3154943 RepID=UPI00341D0C6D
MSTSLTLRRGAASHLGLRRPINEDSLYSGAQLVAIADGVGGEAAGEVASDLAIGALAPLDTPEPRDPVTALRTAYDTANRRIREAVAADPALSGMATTLTTLLLSGNRLILAHAGDSRAYVLHGGEFAQLTRDDTYVQLLVDEGRISPAEASVHPQKSVVTRVLQGEPFDATVIRRRAVPGDRYLLCSDGLSDAVSTADIALTLRTEPDPDRCAARLIQLALEGGGPDNVSVVVADVVGRPRRRFRAVLAAGVVGLVALVWWVLRP